MKQFKRYLYALSCGSIFWIKWMPIALTILTVLTVKLVLTIIERENSIIEGEKKGTQIGWDYIFLLFYYILLFLLIFGFLYFHSLL